MDAGAGSEGRGASVGPAAASARGGRPAPGVSQPCIHGAPITLRGKWTLLTAICSAI